MNDDDQVLARALAAARAERGLSVAALSERSGVSRAMITKVERGQSQPTAALLGRITAVLGLTLSELFARSEDGERRLLRADEQSTWTDPASGYERRSLSPGTGGPIQLVDVRLPPNASVSYPADAYAFVHQQIWVMAGTLTFDEGRTRHDLAAGDCLELGPPAPCTFRNEGSETCRYLVALTRRHS